MRLGDEQQVENAVTIITIIATAAIMLRFMLTSPMMLRFMLTSYQKITSGLCKTTFF